MEATPIKPFVQEGVKIEMDANHIYRVNGVRFPGVTETLADQKLGPSWEYVQKSVLDHAADRGSNVHLACLMLDENDLDWDSLTPEERPYVEAWQIFTRDTGFKTLHAEYPVANLPYQFAGTPDRYGTLRDGCPAVVDIKSGDPAECTSLQTAAYGYLTDPAKVYRRFAVRLLPTGKAKVIEYPIEEYMHDVHVFLGALAAYRWRSNRMKKAA